MKEASSGTRVPRTPEGVASWLRMLTREVNTYVLFLQTWSAMGYMVSPEVVSSLLELQKRVMEARMQVEEARAEELGHLRADLEGIAGMEEEVFNRMMNEIKRFKEETEDLFPALKLNFDPCF